MLLLAGFHVGEVSSLGYKSHVEYEERVGSASVKKGEESWPLVFLKEEGWKDSEEEKKR